MKKITIVIAFLISGLASFGQSQNLHAPVSGYQIPVYAWIQTDPTRDTICFYWNAAEVAAVVTSTVTAFNTKLPITVYTYTATPLNHVSAAPYSICVTRDTGLYIKVGTLSDSANWFKAR